MEAPHREGGPLVQLAGQQMSKKTTLLASEVQHIPCIFFFLEFLWDLPCIYNNVQQATIAAHDHRVEQELAI